MANGSTKSWIEGLVELGSEQKLTERQFNETTVRLSDYPQLSIEKIAKGIK